MSKLELTILSALGFVVFEIVVIRLGFFLGSPIGSLTLAFSFIVYCLALAALYPTLPMKMSWRGRYGSLILFIIGSIGLWLGAQTLSNTYDISWDGQGYHQTA